jgi:perosamine synthetase
VYVIRLDERIDRDRVLRDLDEAGVPARPYFSPIHLQPFYRERFGYGEGTFPVTERVARSTLALPFSSRMTDGEVDQVASALDDAVQVQIGS